MKEYNNENILDNNSKNKKKKKINEDRINEELY